MTVGVDDLDAQPLRRLRLAGRAQVEQRVDDARTRRTFGAGQISRGLLDERDKGRMQRKIVGQILQTGREKHDAALADLLVDEERCPVGQAGNDVGVPGVDVDGVVELYAGKTAGSCHRRVRPIGFADRHELLAAAGRSARVVVHASNHLAEDRHATAARGGAERDQHTPAALHVREDAVFERRRQPEQVGEDDEGVLRQGEIRRLLDRRRLQDERRFGRGVERVAEVAKRSRIGRCMDEEHVLRIRSLYREQVAVVVWEAVARINPDLAAAEAVRHVERWKFDRRAPAGRDLHGLAGNRPAVHHERRRSSGGRRGVSGNHGLHVRRPCILRRTPQLTGSGNALDGPVRRRGCSHRMKDQRDRGRKGHLRECRGHARPLHVADQMQLDRGVGLIRQIVTPA